MNKLWKKYSYAIILIVLSFSVAILFAGQSNDESKYKKVTVSEGDTLWELSKLYSEENSLSNSQFVSWVKKHNNIDGEQIYPGEKIIIPISNTDEAPIQYASGAEK